MHCGRKMRTVGTVFTVKDCDRKDENCGNSSTIMHCGKKMRTVGIVLL